jgi:hypothetical protein
MSTRIDIRPCLSSCLDSYYNRTEDEKKKLSGKRLHIFNEQLIPTFPQGHSMEDR